MQIRVGVSQRPVRSMRWAGAFALLAACGSSDSAPPASMPPEGQDGVFQPKGCAFEVGKREEYKDWKVDHAASGVGQTGIRRVRLGLGGNLVPGEGYADPATSIAIAWQTDDGDHGTEVRWGTSADPASWSEADRATGITWLTPQGMIAPNGDQRMHEAYVCGLQPGTQYFYQVRSGADASEVHSFTTAPSDPGATVSIAVTGDSRGQHENAWQILQARIRDRKPTLQLFSGDMVDIASNQVEWESWVDNAGRDAEGKASAFATTLTLSTHGNHENHNPLYFGNIVVPQSPTSFPKHLEHFFSFDVGPVHVVVVDDFAIGSPTVDPEYASTVRDWLEADLASANERRTQRPWIVVMHHHGEYSSSSHGEDADVLRDREFFVPIWDAAGVNLVVNGHDHNYERTHPLKALGDIDAPKQDPAGTTYIVCAGAGAEGYGAGTSSFTAYSSSYGDVGRIGVYGIVTASPTELRWQAYWLDPQGDTPVEPDVVFQK